jgi:2-polyprenyl-3-methyl-5-hydroxy-6-metoxy-1,4-benzoquinol methylase
MTEMISVGCNLCNYNDAEILFKAVECTGLYKETFSVVQCRHCNLSYVNPRPANKELHKYYPQKSYYAYQNNRLKISIKNKVKDYAAEWASGYRTDTTDKRTLWRLSISKIFQVVTRNFLIGLVSYKKGGKILDVGCGNGNYLEWFKSRGWNVYGVEINEEASNICRRKGINIYNGILQDAKFKEYFFDVVSLVQVLEHMPDPSSSIKEIYRVLKPNGILLIGVPNFGCFDRKLFKKDWIPLEVPRHLYHFELKSLIELLAHHGFEIKEIKAKGFYLFGIKNLLKVSKINKLGEFLFQLFSLMILKTILLIFSKNRKDKFATFISVYCKKSNIKVI